MIKGKSIALGILLAAASGAAMAHGETGGEHHFLSGFAHPFSGWDHILAMVGVGVWSALSIRSRVWVLPPLFVLAMACGFGLAVTALPLPVIEAGIASSVLILGVLIALSIQLPLWSGMLLIGIFALFHGLAHGVEVPTGASFIAYGSGMACATALLHVGGILLGQIQRWGMGSLLIRTGGGVAALVGTVALVGLV
jgi:urease accessory protein